MPWSLLCSGIGFHLCSSFPTSIFTMFAANVVFTAVLGLVSATGAYTTVIPTGPGPVVICTCPADKTGANDTSSDIFVGYKCTYPTGSCVWNVVSMLVYPYSGRDLDSLRQAGGLTTTENHDCPTSAPCPNVESDSSNTCTCPLDLNGAYGTYEGDFFAYTCDYPDATCTYDAVRLL